MVTNEMQTAYRKLKNNKNKIKVVTNYFELLYLYH